MGDRSASLRGGGGEGARVAAGRGGGGRLGTADLGLIGDVPEGEAAIDVLNTVGLDLFVVAVAERACPDAERGDSHYHGKAGRNIAAAVESIDELERPPPCYGGPGRCRGCQGDSICCGEWDGYGSLRCGGGGERMRRRGER